MYSDPSVWVEQHEEYLFRYAMTRLNDRLLAEAMVQETFFSALKVYTGFDGKSSERTWFTSILKHKIIDYYRTLSRRQALELEPEDTGNPSFVFQAGRIDEG